MRIIGIETSCDETAVCLIEASGESPENMRFTVLGNSLYSQIAIHAPYGGVFPNLAKREHQKNLVPVMTEAFERAGVLTGGSAPAEAIAALPETLARESELFSQLTVFARTHAKPHVDVIAVTAGPGLEPALWVGINFAKALARLWDVPIVSVNHMEGHVVISATEGSGIRPIEYPALSLLISGGHTELLLSHEWMKYQLIGQTRDDAVGEAFDKVARLLELPYPGGPEISKRAHEAREKNIADTYNLPRPMIDSPDYDFSFSGLKTAVRKTVERCQPLSERNRAGIALAFENAATEVLVRKTMKAVDEYGVRTVIVGGGVSANSHVNGELKQALDSYGSLVELRVPPPDLATDNALMIALAGYFHAIKEDFADLETLRADGMLRLAQ